MRYITITVLLVFIVSRLLSQEINPKILDLQIKLSPDTVNSGFIKQLIGNDSVLILEYNKLFYDESIVDERVVYIDYSNWTTLKDSLRTFDSQFLRKLNSKSFNFIDKEVTGDIAINPFKELYGATVSLRQLRGTKINFSFDLEYKVVITDSAIFFNTMEGLYLNRYKNISRVSDRYILDIYNSNYYTTRIEIRIIDPRDKIQLWKMTRSGDTEENYSYDLVVPIQESIKYPVLDIYNSGELDDVYDKFDNLDLEKMFSK